jgi:hypothetical protein
MDHIPPELVHAIIDDVISWNSKFYLFKLRMVNKFFCSLVSPKVFRKLYFMNSKKSVLAVKELQKSPNVAGLVQEIDVEIIDDLDILGIAKDPWTYNRRGRNNTSEGLAGFQRHPHAYAFSRLPHGFPALSTLTLTFNDQFEDGDLNKEIVDVHEYAVGSLDIIEAIVRGAQLMRLTSLNINNLLALPPRFQETSSFRESMSSLQHLSIKWMRDIIPPMYRYGNIGEPAPPFFEPNDFHC